MKRPSLALLKPLIVFVVGLLDDVLLIALSRLGLHISWLHWLAPVILGCTVIHCVGQLLPFLVTFPHRLLKLLA